MLFIFSPKLIRAFSIKYQNKIPKDRIILPDQYLLNKLATVDNSSSVIELKGLLYTVASIIEKETEFSDTSYDKRDLLMKIFLFVDEHFRAECSLTELARSVGYDSSYLSRYFKRATNISYNNYVNACRLNHASYLLHNTDQTILESSIESGYRSLRTFNRNFKDYFGKTPQEYKAEKGTSN
jgi:AraC-like DNA-binding protein